MAGMGRMMKKYLRYIIVFILLLLFSSCNDKKSISNTFFAMDTTMTVTIYGKNREKAIKECEETIIRFDSLFSVTDSNSDVSRLNNSNNEFVELNSETVEIIKDAITLGEKTDYLFDITISPVVEAWGFYDKTYMVPSNEELEQLIEKVDASAIEINGNKVKLSEGQKIDLGGIAKGYLSDRIKEILTRNKIDKAVISLGGSVLVIGEKDKDILWNVGLEDPFKEQSYMGILTVRDNTIVTSGDYERFFIENGTKYHHIFDPNTARPASNGLVSVTVIMPNGTKAEVLSTALFIMGEEKAIEYWKTNRDFEMILINDSREVLGTPNLKDSFSLSGDYGYTLRWIG